MSSTEAISVRPIAEADKSRWFELWAGYIDFYQASVADDVSEFTWWRLLTEIEPAWGRVAVHPEHGIVAIMNYVLHVNLWAKNPVCYLEDLYTDPAYRRLGAGRALIESLAETGKKEKWHRLYWMTDKDNKTARKLYDKLATETNWMRYDISL